MPSLYLHSFVWKQKVHIMLFVYLFIFFYLASLFAWAEYNGGQNNQDWTGGTGAQMFMCV